LSASLDVRDVFARVSEIVSRVLPHDAISLPVFTEDGEQVIPFFLNVVVHHRLAPGDNNRV
jgi:hypothetical protein